MLSSKFPQLNEKVQEKQVAATAEVPAVKQSKPEVKQNVTVDLDTVPMPPPVVMPDPTSSKVTISSSRMTSPRPAPVQALTPRQPGVLTDEERRILEERLRQTRELEKALEKRAEDERRAGLIKQARIDQNKLLQAKRMEREFEAALNTNEVFDGSGYLIPSHKYTFRPNVRISVGGRAGKTGLNAFMAVPHHHEDGEDSDELEDGDANVGAGIGSATYGSNGNGEGNGGAVSSIDNYLEKSHLNAVMPSPRIEMPRGGAIQIRNPLDNRGLNP